MDSNENTYYACKGSQEIAQEDCVSDHGFGAVASPANCYSGLETGETTWGSGAWEPANHVNYNEVSGEYEIDEDFVNALMEDGFAPLSQDSARLVPDTGGYYKLDDVASGDLADELGLQDGDVLKLINGYDLNTTEEQLEAYQALKTGTQFALRISRSSTLITINYKIVP